MAETWSWISNVVSYQSDKDGIAAIINRETADQRRKLEIKKIALVPSGEQTPAAGQFQLSRHAAVTDPYTGGTSLPIRFHAYLSSGPNNGSTFVNDASIGTLAWTNPGNAMTSNDIDANATTGGGGAEITNYLKTTGFGFSVPTGATIRGIKMEFERAGTASTDHSIRLVRDGVIVGDNKARPGDPWPVSDAYASYGGAEDLWGATWTVAQINAATFGVGISGNIPGPAMSGFIDHIRITVFYTDLDGGIIVRTTPELVGAAPTLTKLRTCSDVPTLSGTAAGGALAGNLPGRVMPTHSRQNADLLREYGDTLINTPIIIRPNQGLVLTNIAWSVPHAGFYEILFRRQSDGSTYSVASEEVATRELTTLPMIVLQNNSASTVIEVFAVHWFDTGYSDIPVRYRLVFCDDAISGTTTAFPPVANDTANAVLPASLAFVEAPFRTQLRGEKQGNTVTWHSDPGREDSNPASGATIAQRLLLDLWYAFKMGRLRNRSVAPWGTTQQGTLLYDSRVELLYQADKNQQGLIINPGDGIAVVASTNGQINTSMLGVYRVMVIFTHNPPPAGGGGGGNVFILNE